MEVLEAIDDGAVHNFRHMHHPGLTEAMAGLSWLGDVRVVGALLALVALMFLVRKQFQPALALLGVGLVAAGLAFGLKEVLPRKRPQVVWSEPWKPASSSFPSASALLAAAAYPTLAVLVTAPPHRRPRRLLLVLLASFVAFGIGFSRMFLGVSHVTDVLAGWALGALVALIGQRLGDPS